MSANFTPTPHYLDKCTLSIPIFPDTCVKHEVLREIASDFPGKSPMEELQRIMYALAIYPITDRELKDFLGCPEPEKSIRRFAEFVRYMAKATTTVTDEHGKTHQVSAYTLRPERVISWEVFGRNLEPDELCLYIFNVKKRAEELKAERAAQAAKGEGKA